MPFGVSYHALNYSLSPVDRVISVHAVSGKLYVVALFQDGIVRHFYDHVQVTAATNRSGALSGRVVLPFQRKMYSANGTVLYASGISTPNDYSDTATGSGFYDMSTEAAGAEDVAGLGNYQGRMAVFSRRTTQIWSFQADPDLAQQIQVLRNMGTVAPRSVVSFADSDVFFLADSGIRSLRARDASDSAAVSDVGTPIDDIIVPLLRSLSADTVASAHGAIEPTDGRFWLALGDMLYVFTYFPSNRISAWSVYDLPAPSESMVPLDNKMFMRCGNTVYIYGGHPGNIYDETEAEVELPYLDARQVATWKSWKGLDIAGEGQWKVYLNTDPSQPDIEDEVGYLSGSTFNDMAIPINAGGPFVKLRLTASAPELAKLGNLVAHYEAGRAT